MQVPLLAKEGCWILEFWSCRHLRATQVFWKNSALFTEPLSPALTLLFDYQQGERREASVKVTRWNESSMWFFILPRIRITLSQDGSNYSKLFASDHFPDCGETALLRRLTESSIWDHTATLLKSTPHLAFFYYSTKRIHSLISLSLKLFN